MTDKKGWGHTVLGWFVVNEQEPVDAVPPNDPSSAPSEDPPPPAPQPVEATFLREPPKPAGKVVDFAGVLDAAGIAAAERDLFGKAQALLAGLPEGTDPAVKRQIVEASLKAFGIPIDGIIESGAQSIQALEGYIQKGAAETAAFAREVQQLIEGYEKKIRESRELLDKKLADQAAVQGSCNARKLEIQKVLEFFGQDEVARVVQASAKLIDPAAPPERKE